MPQYLSCMCQVDPFLCLVEDSKLQISETGEHQKITYGSQEDDSSALKCLSEIKINKEQTTESLVSVIIKNLDNLPDVSFRFLYLYVKACSLLMSFLVVTLSECYLVQSEESTTREQLLKEFLPDDLGSLKGPLFTDSPEERHKTDSYDHKSLEKVNYTLVDSTVCFLLRSYVVLLSWCRRPQSS